MPDRSSHPALRRLISDRKPGMPLSDSQQAALRSFMSRVESSEYVELPHPCLCGSADDVVVACKDRHGIPLRTVLCRGCGLLRSDPYLSADALVKFYGNEYRPIYEQSASAGLTEFVRMLNHGGHVHRFLLDHDVGIPEHVFDVGCGTGGILVQFLLHGHTVAGCDYGTEHLEVGRKVGLDLYEGGLETLQDRLPPTLIIMRHVLEHFRDPISELNSLCKVLPEGSPVYVELPGVYSIRRSYRDPLLFLQNAHAYHFCLHTLDYVMSLSGFERVYGDERVRAIYRLNSSLQPMAPDRELHRQVLRHLKRIDRVRWFPPPTFWLQYGVKLGRKLLGSRFGRLIKTVADLL